jgi:hypothetical protein
MHRDVACSKVHHGHVESLSPLGIRAYDCVIGGRGSSRPPLPREGNVLPRPGYLLPCP